MEQVVSTIGGTKNLGFFKRGWGHNLGGSNFFGKKKGVFEQKRNSFVNRVFETFLWVFWGGF